MKIKFYKLLCIPFYTFFIVTKEKYFHQKLKKQWNLVRHLATLCSSLVKVCYDYIDQFSGTYYIILILNILYVLSENVKISLIYNYMLNTFLVFTETTKVLRLKSSMEMFSVKKNYNLFISLVQRTV